MYRDIIYELQDLQYLKWSKTRNSSGTAGSFLKSYDDSGKIKKYYKLSDYDIVNGIVGHECVNEIIVGRLMDVFGIEHLQYRLIHASILINDKKIETYLKHNPIEEKEAEINELNEEIVQLKQQLQESKATVESLTSEVKDLKEEKIQLQEDLLNVEDKSEEIIQLQKDHKEEIAELNFKLNNEKDLNKELLVVRSDFLKQNAISRLLKREPESSKRIAKLKELPENEVPVEAKNSKD